MNLSIEKPLIKTKYGFYGTIHHHHFWYDESIIDHDESLIDKYKNSTVKKIKKSLKSLENMNDNPSKSNQIKSNQVRITLIKWEAAHR